MRLLLNGLLGLATLLYPFAVFFGLQYYPPRQIGLVLVALLLLKLLLSHARRHWSTPLLLAGVAYAAFAAWSNQVVALRYYPVLVNGIMLLIFGWSLWFPPTLVERIARLQQPDLSAQGVKYTRRVTQVWCGFFVVNGLLALATALWADMRLWSLYNGLIAYILMGILFLGEYLVRLKVLKHAGQ